MLCLRDIIAGLRKVAIRPAVPVACGANRRRSQAASENGRIDISSCGWGRPLKGWCPLAAVGGMGFPCSSE